jgi:hypothetical protein
VRRILPSTPLDLIDLLFYLQRLEVVKFGFMGLELGVELVFAGFFLLSVKLAEDIESRAILYHGSRFA